MVDSPWLKSGIIAAVVGTAIPVATAVQGYIQKERELAIQENQQFQELKMAYMEFLKDDGLEGLERLATFAAAAEDNARIREWAKTLQAQVSTAIDAERKKLDQQEAAILQVTAEQQRAEQQAKEASTRVEALGSAATDTHAKQRAEQAAATAATEAMQARIKLTAMKERATHSKEMLLGRTSQPLQLAPALDPAAPFPLRSALPR